MHVTIPFVTFLGMPVNVALNKPTSSSNYISSNRKPEKAVDGEGRSHPDYYSCFVTKRLPEPWFLLDLETNYQIDFIRFWNEHHCSSCSSRTYNLYITIGETKTNPKSNPLCVKNADQRNVQIVDYWCDREIMFGRYIYVYLTRTEMLNFCEIEVLVLQ